MYYYCRWAKLLEMRQHLDIFFYQHHIRKMLNNMLSQSAFAWSYLQNRLSLMIATQCDEIADDVILDLCIDQKILSQIR